MKLHRSGKHPDWADIAEPDRSGLQKLAAWTNGVVTVGNTITTIGFLLVVAGLVLILRGSYVGGLVLVAIGRMCDIFDGQLADYTVTKSPLGEIIDAGADKLETLGAAIVFVAAGLLPWWLAAAVAVTQFLIALVSRIAWDMGRAVHPSRLGKFGMAAAWLGLVLFIVPESLHSTDQARQGVVAAAYTVSFISLAMSLYVGVSYARQAFSKR